jgi:Response regulators consisting of a CheY-like receiver domain and a winged-helix DNA-binding domain
VLLDVALPDADGFQILERIRGNPKIRNLPVIMMTGKSEVTDVARGLSLGADGYVTKPFKISGLVQAVNTVLGIEQA